MAVRSTVVATGATVKGTGDRVDVRLICNADVSVTLGIGTVEVGNASVVEGITDIGVIDGAGVGD